MCRPLVLAVALLAWASVVHAGSINNETGQLPSSSTVTLGDGTARGTLLAVYDKQVSAAGSCNTATTSNVTLWTVPTIPANTLNANGKFIEIVGALATASNNNNKRAGVVFQGNTVNAATSTNNGALTAYAFIARITRVTATSVHVVITFPQSIGGSSLSLAVNDLTTTASTLTVVGASPTTGAANDVCMYDLITKVSP